MDRLRGHPLPVFYKTVRLIITHYYYAPHTFLNVLRPPEPPATTHTRQTKTKTKTKKNEMILYQLTRFIIIIIKTTTTTTTGGLVVLFYHYQVAAGR
jgi:hypothetical protein